MQLSGYLSRSHSVYRVVVQGMPICRDGHLKDALAAAVSLNVRLKKDVMWDFDNGGWVPFPATE